MALLVDFAHMLNICLSISSRDKHLTDRCSATTVYIQVASCRFKPVLFRLVAVVIALSARDRSLNQFHSTTQVSYCCRYMCHSHTQCKRGSAAGLSGTLSFLFSSGVGSCDIAERERGREGERERERDGDAEQRKVLGRLSFVFAFSFAFALPFASSLFRGFPKHTAAAECSGLGLQTLS